VATRQESKELDPNDRSPAADKPRAILTGRKILGVCFLRQEPAAVGRLLWEVHRAVPGPRQPGLPDRLESGQPPIRKRKQGQHDEGMGHPHQEANVRPSGPCRRGLHA